MYREKLHGDESFMARWDIFYEFLNRKSPYFWIVEYPILAIIACGKSILYPHSVIQMSLSIVVFAVKLIYIIARRPFVDWLTDVIQGVMAVVSLNILDLVLDAMQTPQEAPVHPRGSSYLAELCNVHPDCLAEITVEFPFLIDRYNRYRSGVAPDPQFLDRMKTLTSAGPRT